MSISISTNMVLLISPLFLDMISSYLSHSFSNALCVFGEISLSSNSTFLWVGASAGDFRKLSFFFMNGFWNSLVIFSLHCLSGIQFLGRSLSSSFIVQISNTSPWLVSFSVNATTWSFGRCKYSWWLKFTITNGVTVSGLCLLDLLAWGMCRCWGLSLTKVCLV